VYLITSDLPLVSNEKLALEITGVKIAWVDMIQINTPYLSATHAISKIE